MGVGAGNRRLGKDRIFITMLVVGTLISFSWLIAALYIDGYRLCWDGCFGGQKCWSAFISTIPDYIGFPSKILGGFVVAAAMYGTIFRSEQTQHQIESARVTNNFKVYTDHQAYFTDLLKSFKDDLKIEPLENRFRYSDFFPDNNIEQMRLTSTGRNNSKSIILEWNDRISQLSKLFQELLAKIDNNNEASEDYVNWLQSFQGLENAFGVCYQSESYRSYIFLVEGGVEVKVDGIPWDIDRCLDAIIDMLHLLNTKLLLDTQHSISVQQFYTSSNSNIEGILTNASTKHVIEGLGTFS